MFNAPLHHTSTIQEVVTLTAHEDGTLKKYTLREARQFHGLTKKELSKLSGISLNAICAIEGGGCYKTNEGVALLLADALALDVCEIEWPRGLSHLGRPPLTGKSIIRERSITLTVTEKVTELCARCHLELPKTGVCGNC